MTFKHDLRWYLSVLVHWAWLLILAGLLAAGIAFAISSRQVPIYQASTTVLIEEAPSQNSGQNYQAILGSERRARTYAELLTASPLLRAVIDQLGLPLSVSGLKDAVSVRPVRETQLIRLHVRDTDPVRAAAVANTLVTTFAEQRRQVQSSRYAASKESFQDQLRILEQQIQQTNASLRKRQLDRATRDRLETTLSQYRESYARLIEGFEEVRIAEAQTVPQVVQEEPAVVPEVAISPRIVSNAVLAGALGFLVALALVFLRELLDDRVKDPEEIAQRLGVTILGVVPHLARSASPKPIVVAQPRSPTAESLRALRTNMEFTGVDRPLRTILITSPAPSEGKSTLGVNLAAVLGQGGRQVMLVDVDLRRSTLHKYVEVENHVGLSNLFVQPHGHVEGAVQETGIPGVAVLTAGPLPPNPAELLGSQRMNMVLSELQEHADVVLLDAPPVTPVTDAVLLSHRVDGVLLVVRIGQTRLGPLKQSVAQLRQVGAHIIGMVVNDLPVGRSRFGYGYHGYYYRSYQDQAAYTSDAEPAGASGPRNRGWRWFGRRRSLSSNFE